MSERILDFEHYIRFSEDKALVSEILTTENSSIAVWGVQPGQEVEAHFHPNGQDTWIMLKGSLTYYLGNDKRQTLSSGQCAIAEKDRIHGAINEGTENAVFVSIYSARKIGYVKASPEQAVSNSV